MTEPFLIIERLKTARTDGHPLSDQTKATYGYQKQGVGYGYCADLMVMPTLTWMPWGVTGPR